ncbi:hypothetical protein GPJ56_010054 [Histomonas meleagridis]|uniref:uncharacterized protein n=1 Tax=Histomonas meleagridis TaxID=135588 RepID=UPI0035595902|nr:hypothetical protein GPJ56_010054 [Histomonas meleagridis]KAH0800089.1 hypothetical protein GO595_007201 [Histomonas meleagridis]
MSGCLRESLIDYALLPSGCRASFLQVLGFVEPYQIPNPTFYRFLNTLFNNDFIGELCQCFCDIEDSYIDFISGADRDEVPSLFQPTVLSNYDKMALLNYRSPFNYKGEISFQTVYWEKKLPPLRDSLRRSSSTQNLVQEIKGFLSQIDFVPLSTNNVDLLRYLKLLADKGPIESKKARVASAQRIYNSIHSRSELWVEDVFDKMAEDDKTELIKLSAFSPMKAQLDKLDIQVDSVVERLYFTTYITLYTKTINKYYDNRQQITLEQAIESPKALKSEYESLTKYVYENNKFVPRQSEVNKTDVNKKLIPDKPVRIDGIKYYEIACHIYITRDFTYDRFKSLLPEFTRLDEKIFETISSKTSDYYIEQQLGSMKAKHRDFLKSYLNDDNAYFYIDDAFQRCDAYGFGDRLVYAINNMFIDCKNAFPNEVFGGDQKEPIVGAFFLCYCPRELLTTFAFYKYFYYDFFYKSKDSTVTQVYGQQKMLLQNILSEEEWNSLPESLKD